MPKKSLPAKAPAKKRVKEFTVRLDATRAQMLDDLMKKTGVGQNPIVNIAISKMHENEFPPHKA